VEEHRAIAVLGHPADGGVEPLGVIGDVIRVERPEVLFVREQVHDLRLVGVFRERLERGRDLVERRAVADDVHAGEDNPAVAVFPAIVSGVKGSVLLTA